MASARLVSVGTNTALIDISLALTGVLSRLRCGLLNRANRAANRTAIKDTNWFFMVFSLCEGVSFGKKELLERLSLEIGRAACREREDNGVGEAGQRRDEQRAQHRHNGDNSE